MYSQQDHLDPGSVFITNCVLPFQPPPPQNPARIFLLYFQLSYLPQETCLQQAGSSAVEGTGQPVLGSSEQRKVPASLSLFLKREKIPALL